MIRLKSMLSNLCGGIDPVNDDTKSGIELPYGLDIESCIVEGKYGFINIDCKHLDWDTIS